MWHKRKNDPGINKNKRAWRPKRMNGEIRKRKGKNYKC